jgi:hypothetical protein
MCPYMWSPSLFISFLLIASLYFPALRYTRMRIILNLAFTSDCVLDTEKDGSNVTLLTSIPKVPTSNLG